MYFVCIKMHEGELFPGDYQCRGVLDNGFEFGTHICSEPGFAPSDLYFNRQPRIEALKELFGITIEHAREHSAVFIPQPQDPLPDWFEKLNDPEIQKSLEQYYLKYSQLVNA